MDDILEIKRRRLPHWSMKGSFYFVTWRLAKRSYKLNGDEKQVVVETLMYFNEERYRLHAYVVMDDHVHVVIQPLADYTLSKLVHSWKSYTGLKINRMRNRTGSLWLDERFDRLIRNERELHQKLEYVISNPQRKWPGCIDYPWVGWFGYQRVTGW